MLEGTAVVGDTIERDFAANNPLVAECELCELLEVKMKAVRFLANRLAEVSDDGMTQEATHGLAHILDLMAGDA